MEEIITMNMQDIIVYCLVGIVVAVFIYFAWASRQEKNNTTKDKDANHI
jgi:heme/copper-type cytochrome/quinol oxidase subunit 2